jgi:lycopene cyclase domain-containing protein
LKLVGLPIEEILFFIVVPYSCIFLYETFLAYMRDRKVLYNKFLYIALGLILFVTALVYAHKTYTMTVLLLTSFVCIMAVVCFREMFESFIYWMYMGVCIILFIIFNYVLTSLPVVTYSPQAIIGARVLTIPIEDFFYNYSLLSLYLALYLIAKKAWVRSG